MDTELKSTRSAEEDILHTEDESSNSYGLDPIKNYLAVINRIPLLKARDEIMTAKAYKLHSASNNQILSAQMRNRLIEANLRLVVSIAKKYSSPTQELIELIQEGNLGLMKAVDKYDPELGYRFSTYATWWIKQSILCALTEKSRLIRLPASSLETLSKLRKLREILLKALGREASTDELGEVLGASRKQLERILLIEEQQEQLTSLDAPTNLEDAFEGNLIDSIWDDRSANIEELIDTSLTADFLNAAIKNVLNDREALVIKMRYGLTAEGGVVTLTELSKILQVSLERVRQLESKALTKLRACLNFDRILNR